MEKICVFGGTTEGRILAKELHDEGKAVILCVATETGGQMAIGCEDFVHVGRLNQEEMQSFLQEEAFTAVIDATHPYAVIVSQNIRHTCSVLQIPYTRVQREDSDYEGCVVVGSTAEAVDYLNTTTGKVLLTVGAKELAAYTGVEQYKERLYPRVLPMLESVEQCHRLGFPTAHIIAMQGPFSENLSRSMMEQLNIEIMVTKDSGKVGGFAHKVKPALDMGVIPVVIARPKEQ